MKNRLKIAFVLTLALMVNIGFMHASVLRVNNNNGVTGVGVYSDLEDAHDAAVAGDTILIDGSLTSYEVSGGWIIEKRLVIFGPGYKLLENEETQANVNPSKIGDITFSSQSKKSKISGCTINSIKLSVDSVTISRNYISNATLTELSIQLNNSKGTIIEQNYLWGNVGTTATGSPSVVIRNNIMGRVVLPQETDNALIVNNCFHGKFCFDAGKQTYAIDVYKSNIFNNTVEHWYQYVQYVGAYYVGRLNNATDRNNTIEYNVVSYDELGGTNETITDWSQIYGANDANYVPDANYTLINGCVAATAAQDGGECGIFGGNHPYVLSGLPPIPHIYEFDADPAGTDQINVTISVKSQN